MRLLADIVIPGHHFVIKSESAPGSDAFVLMTLGFLAFLFIGFSIAGYILWRRSHDPEPHNRLLMELEKDQAAEHLTTGKDEDPTLKPKPWERDADWWKP